MHRRFSRTNVQKDHFSELSARKPLFTDDYSANSIMPELGGIKSPIVQL
jgi:hypothetical protein